LRRGKTRSGFPGKNLACNRNLRPSRCAAKRTSSSGSVFSLRTARMMADRFSTDMQSIPGDARWASPITRANGARSPCSLSLARNCSRTSFAVSRFRASPVPMRSAYTTGNGATSAFGSMAQNHRRISTKAQRGTAEPAAQMAAYDGHHSQPGLCPADEDQVGRMQSRVTKHPAEHGLGEEAS